MSLARSPTPRPTIRELLLLGEGYPNSRPTGVGWSMVVSPLCVECDRAGDYGANTALACGAL